MKKNIYYFNSCFCHVVLYGFIASTEFTSPIIWFLRDNPIIAHDYKRI